jgi:hypothetical protein
MNINSGTGLTMRNTSDLVNEMLAEAKDTWLVAIAVGYHDDTKFVFSSAKEPVKDLNQLAKQGGFPIGLLRFTKVNGTIQGSYRPFSEYETEAWVGPYLAGLLEHTAEIVALHQQTA